MSPQRLSSSKTRIKTVAAPPSVNLAIISQRLSSSKTRIKTFLRQADKANPEPQRLSSSKTRIKTLSRKAVQIVPLAVSETKFQ